MCADITVFIASQKW